MNWYIPGCQARASVGCRASAAGIGLSHRVFGGPIAWVLECAHLSKLPFLFSESFRELCIASPRARRLAQCEVSSFHPGSVDPTKGTRVVLGRGARNFRAAHVCICDSPSGYRRVRQLSVFECHKEFPQRKTCFSHGNSVVPSSLRRCARSRVFFRSRFASRLIVHSPCIDAALEFSLHVCFASQTELTCCRAGC